MATAKVEAIESADAFNDFMEKSEQYLLVIDCHQSWCGPCDTVKPTYNSIFNELKDCEDRVLFLTCNLGELQAQVAELLKSKQTDLDLSTHGCMPFFLIVKSKAIVTTVFGADVPSLKEAVIGQAPMPQKEE